MGPAELPFDPERMLADLRPWVECESPTHDATAVYRMMDLATRDLSPLGAQVERILGRMGYGDCMRATLPHARRGEPGLLLMGRMDTVHPVGTLAALPWRREGNRCYGPGAYDLKGGNLLVLEAIRQFVQAGIETPPPVTVLFTSDEEVGSPSTRDLIEAEASRHAAVLVPEPGGPGHEVTTGRYAHRALCDRDDGAAQSCRRPAVGRAFRHPRDGPADHRDRGHDDGGLHVQPRRDPGRGVGELRRVPCTAQVLSMAKRQADLDRGVEQMLALAGRDSDVRFDVTRTVTRPVWEPDARTLALPARAEALAKQIGIPLAHRSAGGGSDGNFTGRRGCLPWMG